jgi:hypothetical protein
MDVSEQLHTSAALSTKESCRDSVDRNRGIKWKGNLQEMSLSGGNLRNINFAPTYMISTLSQFFALNVE